MNNFSTRTKKSIKMKIFENTKCHWIWPVQKQFNYIFLHSWTPPINKLIYIFLNENRSTQFCNKWKTTTIISIISLESLHTRFFIRISTNCITFYCFNIIPTEEYKFFDWNIPAIAILEIKQNKKGISFEFCHFLDAINFQFCYQHFIEVHSYRWSIVDPVTFWIVKMSSAYLPRIKCVIALMQAGCSGRNLTAGTCDATLWGIPCAWHAWRRTIARTANRATVCCIQVAANARVRRTSRWTNRRRAILARIGAGRIPDIFVAICFVCATRFGTIFVIGSVV